MHDPEPHVRDPEVRVPDRSGLESASRSADSSPAAHAAEDPDVRRMLAFRAGDDAAFDALFERWAGPLLGYLERMVGDAAIAEELVQESFLRVHRARDRYDPRAKFSSWLYRIATNLALNELRRAHRRHPHASTDARAERGLELRASEPSAVARVEARQMNALVEDVLDALPARQRMALWLSAVEGFSYAEVAATLETSESSVKALVHRARAALVDRVQEGEKSRSREGGDE